MKTFKIIVVGDACVGKTTFIKRHLTGKFEEKYMHTTGSNHHDFTFKTNEGLVTFEVWDCESKGREIYEPGYDGAILMFSHSDMYSMYSVPEWKGCIANTVPVVLCGNKLDLASDPDPDSRTIFRNVNCNFCDISVKDNTDCDKPFLYLARRLMKNKNLCFVEASPKSKTNLPKIRCSNKKISWMRLPGKGAIKVTHKFYDEEEVMDVIDK